jgi:poly(3-hydroxybutyrate) depolymerase
MSDNFRPRLHKEENVMRSSVTSNVLFAGLVTGLASVYGCSSGGGGNGNPFGASAGSSGSAGAQGSSAGAQASAGAQGSAGDSASAGAQGSSAGAQGSTGGSGVSTAGATGTDGGAGAGGGTTGTAGASTGGAGTSGPFGDITKVMPSMGCGMTPPAVANGSKQTIQTMGTKPANCADSNCAPWSYARDYYVTLPANYDKTKAYPLVFQGPGCGGNGAGVYLLSPSNGMVAGDGNVNQTVIRVGLTPPPNAIGHATNPNQGCFDDKEGDSSVDWVFYENLYDHLNSTLCFDRNRVFSSGDSSGAWFSNEVGCKYAGDATRPIRGIMPNTGGLPMQAMYEPTCTNKPLAGMWVGETNDPQNAFVNNEFAISRALVVNGCTMGTTFDAVFPNAVNYPIGNMRPDNVCKLIQGCPTIYPLVVCLITGNGHNSHPDTTNPGFSKFITQFITPGPFLTQ